MGARGPVPKRSTERRRRNKASKPDIAPAVTATVDVPKANSRWHPIARRWYDSLAKSGQSQFFEPSDWTSAYLAAEMMSALVRQPRPSAQMFAALWSAMADLLTTEAARRRVRLEIDRGQPDEGAQAGVTAIGDYRRRLAAR